MCLVSVAILFVLPVKRKMDNNGHCVKQKEHFPPIKNTHTHTKVKGGVSFASGMGVCLSWYSFAGKCRRSLVHGCVCLACIVDVRNDLALISLSPFFLAGG